MSLQTKKNAVRKELANRGVLKRGGKNDFDHYSYFSEAQYKELFTELFANNGLEFKASETEVIEIAGTQKQPFAKRVKMEITLTDCDKPEDFETVTTYGEGMDKGDKALFKAKTGALKYYLADNFLVATGDDPEEHSNDADDSNAPKVEEPKCTKVQIEKINELVMADKINIDKMLEYYGVKTLGELTVKQASQAIAKGVK